MIKLFPHQDKGLDYLTNRGSGFLFWKPRVGKTLPALYRVLTSKTLPILIVTKPSIMETFRKALHNDMNIKAEKIGVCYTHYTKTKKEKVLEEYRIVICNYQSAIPLRIMTAQKWKAIIFDESLALGNLEAKVTRYIERKIKDQPEGQVRIALTGTPAPESPRQYASQFFIVDGQFCGYDNIHEYMSEEWVRPRMGGKWKPVRNRHLEEIHEYIHEHASFLTMEELGKGSEILYNQRYVHLNDKQEKLLEWAQGRKEELNKVHHLVGNDASLGNMVYAMYENMIASGIDPVTREVINFSKINDVLDCYLDNREPILVASFFVDLLPWCVKIFEAAGVPCAYMDSTVIDIEKEDIRQRFQDGELQAVFGQSNILAEGKDFSRADTTYNLNNCFSLNVREQLTLRTTNINKTTPVEIIDICTEETFENKVVRKLNAKEKISDSFFKKYCRVS